MSFIKEYKDAVPHDVCESVIRMLEENCDMKPGRLLSGVNPKIKKSLDFKLTQDIINNNRCWHDIDRNITKIIRNYLNKYLYDHVGAEIFRTTDKFRLSEYLGPCFKDGVYLGGLQFQKYIPGYYFKPHTDDTISDLRPLIAVIVYLNDVKKSDGGSTRFYNGREVQPETGKIVFFPSTWNYLHQGTELKNGTKYIITSFIYSVEYDKFIKLKHKHLT
jgi:hypothetical protein